MFYSRGILILSKDRADVKYVEKAYAKHTRVFLDTCLHVDTWSSWVKWIAQVPLSSKLDCEFQ